LLKGALRGLQKFGEYQFSQAGEPLSPHKKYVYPRTIVMARCCCTRSRSPRWLTSEPIRARLPRHGHPWKRQQSAKVARAKKKEPLCLLRITYKFNLPPARRPSEQVESSRMQQGHAVGVLQEIWDHRMADFAAQIAAEQLVTRRPRNHREGDHPGPEGAHARRNPSFVNRPQARDQAAVRSDHHLRPGGRQGPRSAGRSWQSEILQPPRRTTPRWIVRSAARGRSQSRAGRLARVRRHSAPPQGNLLRPPNGNRRHGAPSPRH